MANPAMGGDPPNGFSKVVAFLGSVFLQCAPALTLGSLMCFSMMKSSETLGKSVERGSANLCRTIDKSSANICRTVEKRSANLSKGIYDGLVNIGGRKGGYCGTIGYPRLPKLHFA